MAKCSKCGEEVDGFILVQAGHLVSYLTLDGKGDPLFEDAEFIEGDKHEVECPGCNEVLFTDREEAIAFLKG